MNEDLLKRITTSRKILDGKPIIRDHPIAVEQILGRLAAGDTYETLREEYPSLEREDIQACLLYAQNLVQNVRSVLKVEELADFIPAILEQAPYLKLLVLFGSRARGDASSESDWDFAFLCDEEQRQQYEKGGWDFCRISMILQEIYGLKDNEVDVVDLKECSNFMAHSIAQNGKVLYEREVGQFKIFCQEHLMSSTQLKSIRQQNRDAILKTVQEMRRR